MARETQRLAEKPKHVAQHGDPELSSIGHAIPTSVLPLAAFNASLLCLSGALAVAAGGATLVPRMAVVKS